MKQLLSMFWKIVCLAVMTFILLFGYLSYFGIDWRDTLVIAAREGDIGKVSILLSVGADPSRVGWEEHLTPLGAAAMAGRINMVRYLLRKGADINRRDDFRHTALYHARSCRHPEVAALLEKAGAIE